MAIRVHATEPWRLKDGYIYDAGGRQVGAVDRPGDGEHIVACVNALAGASQHLLAEVDAGRVVIEVRFNTVEPKAKKARR